MASPESEHGYWMSADRSELAEQTRLLRQIARHTRLQYVLTWVLLGIVVLALVGALEQRLSDWARAHVVGPANILILVALVAGLAVRTWPSDKSGGTDA